MHVARQYIFKSVHYIKLINLGLSDYQETWQLQTQLFNNSARYPNQHFLLLTEHHPVITIGRNGSEGNLIASKDFLRSQGIQVIDIDRGGDITFHGPGQIVGYPIMNLSRFKKDIHWYLRALEEVIIRTIAEYGIHGERNPGLTGVWVGSEKICAIGIKVTRWVTKHGFALNVSTDLAHFNHIIPCGLSGKGVTSISQLTGNIISVNDVLKTLLQHFENVFSAEISEKPKEKNIKESHV